MSGTHEKAPVEEQELYSSWALLIQITLLIGYSTNIPNYNSNK
ncbi:6138_t:CDS:2 [Entrophospora sp. SA101]|nr:6138_t:CDS:2 [Entrophospora sp. SA101]